MEDSNFIMCAIKMGWKADWTVRGSYKKQPEETDTKPRAFQMVSQSIQATQRVKARTWRERWFN